MAFPPNAAQPAPMPAGPGAAPAAPPTPQQGAQAVATAFHNQVLQRLRTLQPQEKQTLIAGITPPVAVVLKKILPELADIIDKVAPSAPAAPMPGAPPAAAPPAGGAPFQKPTSRLNGY
jgi:translation initiation factor IF-2